MAELVEKKKTLRYPMGTIKQARSTIARLTRDLLHGRIDKEKYRAACYGLSVLCGLFKLETPVQIQQSIEARNRIDAMLTLSPEQRRSRIKELLTKIEDETTLRSEATGQIEHCSTREQCLPAESSIIVEDTGAAWQPCGIGAKNR